MKSEFEKRATDIKFSLHSFQGVKFVRFDYGDGFFRLYELAEFIQILGKNPGVESRVLRR